MMKYLIVSLMIAAIAYGCKEKTAPVATDPLERLIEGNERYAQHHEIHPDQTKQRMVEISAAQHPFAVVVSCSDSRVPPELIFDQGLGDLFVIRTAGHVLGDYEIASIEYAVEHLHVKNVVVLGHESCGAIKTLLEHPKDSLPGHLNHLVSYLRNETEEQAVLAGDKDLKHAIYANIEHAVAAINNSEPFLKEAVEKNKLHVYGAYYHLADGKVDVLRKYL